MSALNSSVWGFIPYGILLLLIGITPAFAIPPNSAEIVITDIFLDPPHPQIGDKVSIVGSVYNGGVRNTAHHASVVTVAFFIDGELRKITELEDVKPGEVNEISVSSGQLWDTEFGEHDFEIILDYHDTLQDAIDNPKNNALSKKINIQPLKETSLEFSVFPRHLLPGSSQVLTIEGNLSDKGTNTPLAYKEVIVKIADSHIPISTDAKGKFRIEQASVVSDNFTIDVSYEGSYPYMSSHHTKPVFVIPSATNNPVFVLELIDSVQQYDFNNLDSEIIIFQDTYDDIYKKITPSDSSIIDDRYVWFHVDPDHTYLAEIYVHGRYFFTVDWTEASPNDIIEKTLLLPNYAQIQFRVIDSEKKPVSEALVENWISSEITDDYGNTKWIDTLPTQSKNEPYVAVVKNESGQIFRSEPFFVSSEERKIIEITAKESESLIPKWVKNSAKWWANNQISSEDFVTGIEYLLDEKVIIVPESQTQPHVKNAEIPLWVKNNAKWWSEELLSDNDFVTGLQYLIKSGIIRV